MTAKQKYRLQSGNSRDACGDVPSKTRNELWIFEFEKLQCKFEERDQLRRE